MYSLQKNQVSWWDGYFERAALSSKNAFESGISGSPGVSGQSGWCGASEKGAALFVRAFPVIVQYIQFPD
jgi:hypothetical protein